MTDFLQWPDVAGLALGGSVVTANDESFAEAANLIRPSAPRHDPQAFGPRGKLYDGWETRRRRVPGSDHVVLRLAVPAIVRGVDIDTSFFRGNYPPEASVEATTVLGYPDAAEVLAAEWHPIVETTGLHGDSAHQLAATGPEQLVTHVRLTIHPDGGVARFRVYGEVVPDPRRLGGRVDLASMLLGGTVPACSDRFYAAAANVLLPGRAAGMGEGWETARRRNDGNDWLVVRLGAPGTIHHAVLDTAHFIGNCPGAARLSDPDSGTELLGRTRLQPSTEHWLPVRAQGPSAAVRLDIYPDGGLSRLRLFGEVDQADRAELAERWLGLLPPAVAGAVDRTEFFA